MNHKEQREREELAKANAAFENAKAERKAVIGQHLKQLGQEQTEDAQMVNIITQAAIQAKGLPRWPNTNEKFARQVEDLAARISEARRKREWMQVEKLLGSLNARDPNPVMVAAALRTGVELGHVEREKPNTPRPAGPQLVMEG